MPKLTRILAAIVDTHKMTLYKEDGETVIIPQGDARLRRIVDIAGPMLEQYGYADVDLSETAEDTTYVDFEANTNGIVKFFRVAKEKLKQLLALGVVEEAPSEPIAPTTMGVVPGSDNQEEHFDPVEVVAPIDKSQKMSAVDEIIAHAVPVTSENFTEEGIVKQRPMQVNGHTEKSHPSEEAKDTIIAVVNNKVIPNMELIKSQISRANRGSAIGVERFLQRLSTVIDQRSHSVEDLLRFLERADLPISDDGSILIYKVLNRRGDTEYRDCHSGRVTQFVGAYVCMDKSLVDHQRNNECSNGLHVARRGYIRSFSGNVCVLAKLAPEDVITVPSYDANKMRVCGYHILFELTPNQYGLLKNNQPLTNDLEGKELLAKAMRGDHIHKTHEVRITGSMGEGVVITPLKGDIKPELAPEVVEKVEEALSDDQVNKDEPVVPANVAETIVKAKTRAEQAQELYDNWVNATSFQKEARLKDLLTFKKAAKVGWDRLGIPDPTKPVPAKPKAEVIKSPLPKKKAEVIKGRNMPKAGEDTDYGRNMAKQATKVMSSPGVPRERIHRLLAIGMTKDIATHVLAVKKQSKKSWETLGVDATTVAKLIKLTET